MRSLLGTTRSPAPPDEAAVRTALAGVHDPEIGRPLADLGMLRRVCVARAGRVQVEVALTTPSCPLRDRVRDEVTAAVRSLPGVSEVDVVFGALDDAERLRLAERLRAERPGGSDGSVAAAFGPSTRCYAVASGKGGVGKSAVTANLAVALATGGLRVGLLDADVWGYSVPQLFGVRRAPVAVSGLMMPVEAYGVRLMSVGFFVDEEEPVVWRGPMLHKAIEQFLGDVHWGELDVLLLDLPPGTGDVTLSLLELLPQAALLAVTTPQPAAQTVASRVGRMAGQLRMPVAGVVENMTELVCAQCGTHSPLFGSGGGERLAGQLGVPLLGQVPLDVELRQAADIGVPVVAGAPDSPAAVELRRIAAGLPVVRRSLVGIPLPLSVR